MYGYAGRRIGVDGRIADRGVLARNIQTQLLFSSTDDPDRLPGDEQLCRPVILVLRRHDLPVTIPLSGFVPVAPGCFGVGEPEV